MVCLTDSMDQSSSWEANSHSASQETPCYFWNPNIYRVLKSLSLVPILSQMYPVHTILSYLHKIHSSTIFPTTLRSPKVVSSLQIFWPRFCMHF